MHIKRPSTHITQRVCAGSGLVRTTRLCRIRETDLFHPGTFSPLVSITTSRALGFSIYRKAKYTLDGYIETATGSSPLQHVNKPGTYPNSSTLLCFTGAGMISGGVTAFVLSPVELIKNATQSSVLMASQHSDSTSKPNPAKNYGRVSSWTSTKRIIARRGVSGLWTGFRLHLLRDVIGSGIYFGVYETTKQSLNSYYGAERANTPGAIAMAGAICGIGAWVVVCLPPCPSLPPIHYLSIDSLQYYLLTLVDST